MSACLWFITNAKGLLKEVSTICSKNYTLPCAVFDRSPVVEKKPTSICPVLKPFALTGRRHWGHDI